MIIKNANLQGDFMLLYIDKMYSKYEIKFLGVLSPIFFVDYGFSLFFKKIRILFLPE